jgi:hypothetical protein
MIPVKLETRYPSHQNAIDLFGDRWLVKLEEVYPGVVSGPGHYIRFDIRPIRAANQLGFVRGSLHGMQVLELGPMEGAHTYHLSKLGADKVIAIEANSSAFLRCLVMKEILRPENCHFLLGDFLPYLEQNPAWHDLIFCSGVLYHMEDPFRLIEAMCRRTDRVFLWTHYFDPNEPKGPACRPIQVERGGTTITYHQHAYGIDINNAPFWGGVTPTPCWMERDDIVGAFERFGFKVKVLVDDREMSSGMNVMAVAIRNGEFNVAAP